MDKRFLPDELDIGCMSLRGLCMSFPSGAPYKSTSGARVGIVLGL